MDAFSLFFVGLSGTAAVGVTDEESADATYDVDSVGKFRAVLISCWVDCGTDGADVAAVGAAGCDAAGTYAGTSKSSVGEACRCALCLPHP